MTAVAEPVPVRSETPVPTAVFSPARAALRLAAYLSLTVALIPVQAVAVALRLPLARTLPRWYHGLCCRICGFHLLVTGRRAKRRPVLFVGNHSSYIDIMVYGAVTPGSFVAKTEVSGWPLFGVMAKLQRTVFIGRNARAAHLAASEIGKRLKARDNLILFPEGTSNDGTRVMPFKSALFAAAELEVRGQPVTVQPVTISYATLDGMPIGRHLRPFYAWFGDMEMAGHMWRVAGLGRTTVVVQFGEPTTLTEQGSRKALADYCWQTVAKAHSAALTGQVSRRRRRRLLRRKAAG